MEKRYALADILLVEDSLPDIELVRYVFEEAKICNYIQVIMDGREAMNRLLLQNEYARSSLPDIVFLDLTLPGISGREVLEHLVKENVPKMPVIVLTGCEAERSYAAQSGIPADCFLVKPITHESLLKIIQVLQNLYWGLLTKPKNALETA